MLFFCLGISVYIESGNIDLIVEIKVVYFSDLDEILLVNIKFNFNYYV